MKNDFKKILLIMLSFFVTFNFVYASENDTDENIPNSASKVEKQKQAITNYCTEGSKVDGCLYDKKDDMYTTLKGGEYTYIIPPETTGHPYTGKITIPDLEVLRGYQAFDGDGKAIYAACFRYEYNDYKKKNHTGLGNGTYFFFRFVTENSKGTCEQWTIAVPSEGTKSYTYIRNLNPFSGNFLGFDVDSTYTYDGQETVTGKSWLTGEDYFMRFNDWVAVDDGDCPKVFGYTANTQWYTSGSNRYIFSENTDDFNIGTVSFFHGEEYVARPGCTVDDQAGEQVNRELLLSEIKTEINNYSCPDKISDMYLLSNELTGYYETLRNDENNKYRVLWSHDLAEEVITESESQINKYIKEKLTACQYQICNVNTAEQAKIKQNLGEDCKLGCAINNYNKPSQEAGAQCYCCGGSQGCTYKWMKATSGSQCALQEDVPMGLCIGTTKDVQCRSCLIEAYEKAGLDETKSKCLIDSEILKNVTEADLQAANDQAAGDALTTEMEENEKIRDEIFANLIKQPDLDVYDGNLSCAELLGSGLTKVLNFAIDTVRIIGVIAAIVMAMVTLIPAVNKGDQGELNRAIKKCIWIAVVLVLVVLFPLLVRVIGNLFEFDTSCIY